MSDRLAISGWRCIAVLALIAWVGSVAGCADFAEGSPSVDEPTELVLVTTGGQTGEAARDRVREFERDHPHLKVRVVLASGQHYYVKSLTMIAGRAPVDVLWLGQGFGMFAARGALLDLSPFIASDPGFDLDQYFQPVVDWYRHDGRLYGIPTGIDLEVVGYHREHVEDAGLREPGGDWTVDDLVVAGRTLTDDPVPGRRRGKVGLGFEVLPLEYYGLRLLTPDDRAFALNTPAGRQWLEMNRHFSGVEPILAYGGDREAMDRLGAFIGGQVSLTQVYTWDIATLSAQMRAPWGVAPVPRGPDGERRAWASSAGFSIAHHSDHPEEAWLLLKYLVDESFQERGLDSRIPALTGMQEQFVAAGDPAVRRVFLDSLDYLQPTPRIGALQEVTAEWEYWRDRAILGQVAPAEALREAERHINRILAYHRGS